MTTHIKGIKFATSSEQPSPLADAARAAPSTCVLMQVHANDASTANFAYDNDGLMTGATATVGGVALTRDASAGYITGITVGNASSQQSFTDFGELTHLATAVSGAALFEQSIVERDALGRIRHLTEAVQGVAHDIYYEYDLAGRLAKQMRDGTNTIYSYDSNGNRTGVQTGSAAATSATYDAQDRILTSGAQNYEHDAHGDLKSRSDGTKSIALNYDELGNLMKVVTDDGTTKRNVEYVVDGLGRRVARRVNGQFDKAWLYRDALRPIAEVAADGSFTHFVYASNDPLGGAPVAMIRAGVFYRVVSDHLGSVRLVVNAQTGAVAQSIDYDAYGRVLNETGAGFQPFGFAGGLYDSETKLVRFGARDYDADTGRWTNKDPIGFAGQQGNQYAYVNGEPVNRRDPDGKDWTKDLERILRYRTWERYLDKLLSKAERVIGISEAFGYAKCLSVIHRYSKAQDECISRIREACGNGEGWEWAERPECEEFDGGMDGRQIFNCAKKSMPQFQQELLEECSIGL